MEAKKVLLVEDDFLNRRLSKKILSEEGFSVYEAKNATQAIQILNKENINLVILDINLGEDEQDGISIGKKIMNEYLIPFIYLTAYETSEIISKAIATKPYSYLTKPFKNTDLITSVKIAINQSANNLEVKPKILVKEEYYNVELPIDEINYIESEGNYLLLHTDHNVYKYRSTIKQIMELLPQTMFIQTHRAFIVNKRKIEKFNLQNLIIKDRIIPITKTYVEGMSSFDK